MTAGPLFIGRPDPRDRSPRDINRSSQERAWPERSISLPYEKSGDGVVIRRDIEIAKDQHNYTGHVLCNRLLIIYNRKMTGRGTTQTKGFLLLNSSVV